MKKSHNIKREEKFSYLTNIIDEQTIRRLMLEENYSFGMVRELLLRDYPQVKEEPVVCDFINDLQTFRNVLKSVGLSFDVAKYNKKSQAWKIQFRFPSWLSEEEIKRQIKNSSSIGQKKTVEKRKKNNTYKPSFFDKKWSPLTLQFYTEKGWSEEEAQKRIREICSSGARRALKKTQKPSTEKKIKQVLENKRISFTTQFTIFNESKTDDRIRFVYDFLLPDSKTIIEVNGDYWHANPSIYSGDEVISYPSGLAKAKDIWERDNRKTSFAIEKGYSVITIWEYDINHNFKKVLGVLNNV